MKPATPLPCTSPTNIRQMRKRIDQLDQLRVPEKSSCFFCPAMKKAEILDLQVKSPDLLQRALKLEATAVDARKEREAAYADRPLVDYDDGAPPLKPTTIRGLGRRWAWKDFLDENKVADVLDLPDSAPCDCTDDDAEDQT